MSSTATIDGERQRLHALVGELRSRDGWSRERLEGYQRRRLRELIEHAVGSSPYYREVLGPDAADRPLAELPVLTKATLMERFDEIVTDRRLRLADLEAHLAGPEPASWFAGEFAVMTTSGTTGERGVFVYSPEDFRVAQAATLRALARLGAHPGMRVVGIGAPSPLHISRRLFSRLEADGSSRPPELSVLTPVEELVGALNALQPEVMVGYPSVYSVLAAEQLAGRLRISPVALATGAEVQREEVADAFEAAWGVRAANVYATTEVCVVASSCPRRVGLHVCEDLAVIEIVDRAGDPVPPGTPGDRVLITNLVNRAQPLIRYELTDSVTLAAGPNPTGMPWSRIEQVDGRSAEILRLPGRRGEVQVHPYRLRQPFARLSAVVQYQFAFDGERLSAAVVLQPGADGQVVERVRAALASVLDDAGVVGIRVDARAVDAIPREPGGGAKLKQVKRGRGAGGGT
jgi:phenylacetate-CoA ligase